MAEGEDRERESQSSGDDARSDEYEYDPGTEDADAEEGESETSGDDEPAEEEDQAYDPGTDDGDGDAEADEEDQGPAFHPHDRARTEKAWAEDEDESEEPDEEVDDELPDDQPPPGDDSEKSREQERRQKDTPDEEETREHQDAPERDEDEDEEEDAKGPPPPFRAFMLFVATIVFLIVGLLLFAAVIAPTYIVALILAALWFVGAYWLLGRWTRNRRHLRFPIRIAFGGTVLVILIWILINSFNGKTVHEQLVTGQKLSQAEPTARIPEQPAKPTPPRNRLIATGKLESAGAGSASGDVAYVQLQNGTVMVTIKGLDVMSAPT